MHQHDPNSRSGFFNINHFYRTAILALLVTCCPWNWSRSSTVFGVAIPTVGVGLPEAIAFSTSDLEDLQNSRECPKCDLREADLRGAYLEGANLREARVNDTDLRRANLRNSDLRDADLTNVDLRGADLRGANLRGAALEGANLMHIQMDANTRLDRRWLEVVTLVNDLNRDRPWTVDEDLGEQADIYDLLREWAGIDRDDPKIAQLFDDYRKLGFTEGELQRILGLLGGVINPPPEPESISAQEFNSAPESSIEHVASTQEEERFDFIDLAGVNFSHANLQNLDFSGEDLTAAIFQGADLSESQLDGIAGEDSQWAIAHLAQADLSRAQLANAQFPAANLDRATLINAAAPDANFQGVTARETAFNGSLLEDANLQGGNFAHSDFAPSTIVGHNDTDGDRLDGDSLDGDRSAREICPTDLEDDVCSTNLEGANLSSTNFRGANLSNASLYKTDARGIQFDSSTILSGADLRRMELQGANLARVQLEGTNLAGSDLTDANLMGARMEGTDLTGATLTNADLRGVDLRSLTLHNTDLQGAQVNPRPDFSTLDFRSAQFQQQEGNRIIPRLDLDAVAQALSNVMAENVTADDQAPENWLLEGVDLRGVELVGADFSGMTLRGVNLENANLERASFLGATLEDVNLAGANLQYANFQRATLIRTQLEGADLSHAYFGANDPNPDRENCYWSVAFEEKVCEEFP